MQKAANAQAEKLAINGGTKVRDTPFPPRHLFGEEEKQAAVRLFDQCIETGNAFGYGGHEEQQFCEAFANQLGGGFADGVNSGTNAVYVALRSLELEPFTEVIVPPISDPGGIMPVAMMNCIPVPADSAPGSYNTDAERIAARLTDRTSAILVAHIAGVPVNMPPIMKLASERGIPVVEDAAQAHGATCQGKPVGTFGEVASFSTMFGKHIATGGQGGVVFTKSEDRYWKVRRFADRGKPLNLPDAGGCVVASLNCNMDELHAAIGRVQLKKLPAVVAQRRAIALKIQEKCAHRLQSVRLVGDPSFGEASFWFLQFKIDSKALSVDKLTFVQALAAEGIPAEPSYLHCPSVWPWFKDRKVFGSSQLPWSHDAERVSDSIVCDLPNVMATDASQFRISLHENWSDNEIDDVVAALAKVENVYRP